MKQNASLIVKLTIIFTVLAVNLSAFAMSSFFENSYRHDGGSFHDPIGQPIVHLIQPGSCTGFFVANAEDRPLIATARHCARYKLTEACKNGQISFLTEAGKFEGTCKNVIAETPETDMAIFEAEFADWSLVLPHISFLKLSAQLPRANTQLKMLGYPADPERNSAFTITEKCWITNHRPIEFQDLNTDEQKIILDFNARYPAPAEAFLIKRRFRASHNCSVYGGNSGGPILVDGTDIVLGLPTTYWPNIFRRLDSTKAAAMEATADFIARFKDTIKAYEIVISKPYRSGRYVAPFKLRKSKDGKVQCYENPRLKDSKPVLDIYCE